MKKRMLISEITIDSRLQQRQMNLAYVDELVSDLLGGTELPPVDIIFDGQVHWLYNGYHRIAAAKKHGLHYVEANVYDGDFRAAFLASLGENATHGLRRSREDVKRVLARCFSDPEISKKSDTAISKIANVAPKTVKMFRKNLEENMMVAGTSPVDESAISTLDSNSTPPLLGGTTGEVPTTREVERGRARRAFAQLLMSLQQLGEFRALRDEMTKIREVADLF